jgi:hypothetical protein
MDLPLEARVEVPEGTLVREIEGEAVILSLATERYFGLDAVGTRMWRALTASRTIQAAFETLLSEYAVDEETLRRDLHDFVGALAARGLLAVEGATNEGPARD